jgi:hypothetical protein
MQEFGPTLRMPHSSRIEMSKHPHLRELRIQHEDVRNVSYTHSIRACRDAADRG